MSHTCRIVFSLSLVLSSMLIFGALPSSADDKESATYPESGKVLATSPKGMHFYQVASESRVYLLLCANASFFHFGFSECKLNGKPIAAGDSVRFRIDGDWAYMPASEGAEEKLQIFTVELKSVLPAAPPSDSSIASPNGKGPAPGIEIGTVIGTGIHIQGQTQGAWSTNPSSISSASLGARGFTQPIATGTPSTPVIASGPVMATPVTGGAPVLVMPAGPVSGGVITGIPVAGGAPVVGMPTGPVMGTPAGGPRTFGGGGGGGGGPHWVHLLHVQAGNKTYQLECSGKPCEIDNKQIALGDTLAIRIEKKWAYVSYSGAAAKEQKLRILTETEADPALAPQ